MDKDGIYLFKTTIQSNQNINVFVHIEMISPYGYLSAAIWPLLPVSITILQIAPSKLTQNDYL